MSDIVIFDTSVIVDHLRTGRHQQRIEFSLAQTRRNGADPSLKTVRRCAAPVLSRGFIFH